MNNYYIYIYLDPRKSGQYCYNDLCFLYEPFYIGKGKIKRCEEINWNRNKYFKNKINKIKKSELEPIVIKLYENISEQQSFDFEKQFIREIGRFDLNLGTLLNMTDGGEGSSGLIFSEEHRKKLKKSHEGKKHIEKVKKIMSEQKIGKNNPNFGKNFSGENGPNHKKTKQEIINIKIDLKNKLNQKDIAKKYNISQTTVSSINIGKRWSHIKIS
jgi:hypothetical protein